MHRSTIALLAAAAPLALVGCGQSSAPDSRVSQSPPRAEWLVASAPADARPVAQVKTDAAEGERVVVRGRIGGRAEPISADSPVFIIMDLSVPSCAELEDDHCPAPWDYCCEPAESIKANSATIQLVSETGTPLDADPIAAGLAPLDEVIVVGTVGARPSQDVLTIRATQVHRVNGAG